MDLGGLKILERGLFSSSADRTDFFSQELIELRGVRLNLVSTKL